MNELLPLLLGALVGAVTRRARLRAVLLPAGCAVAGWTATLATGEIATSPWFAVGDAGLAAVGAAAMLVAGHARARRARRPRAVVGLGERTAVP